MKTVKNKLWLALVFMLFVVSVHTPAEAMMGSLGFDLDRKNCKQWIKDIREGKNFWELTESVLHKIICSDDVDWLAVSDDKKFPLLKWISQDEEDKDLKISMLKYRQIMVLFDAEFARVQMMYEKGKKNVDDKKLIMREIGRSFNQLIVSVYEYTDTEATLWFNGKKYDFSIGNALNAVGSKNEVDWFAYCAKKDPALALPPESRSRCAVS